MTTAPRRPVGTNAYHCTPNTPQSVPVEVVDRLRYAAEVEGGTSPGYGEMLEDAADTIAALIAERDKLKAELLDWRNWSDAKLVEERDKLTKEVDVYKAMLTDAESEVETLVQQRDRLLKDRADLAKQINNDTDLIAKLREADGLDIIPTLAAAYKEIAALKEELNAEIKLGDARSAECHALRERVSVLEKALEQYANMEKEGDPPSWRGTPYLARAALRTSEDAK